MKEIREVDAVDYAARLALFIRPADVEAVRALDAGVDPRFVWLRWQEALLPPALASALALARRNGGLTNQDLREQDPSLSASSISNRMAELERRGMLVKAKALKVKGGGRRYAYVAWDQAEAEDM